MPFLKTAAGMLTIDAVKARRIAPKKKAAKSLSSIANIGGDTEHER